MQFKESLFKKKDIKSETISPEELKFVSFIEALKGIPGPEFIAKLREIKNENPDFESFVDSYNGDKRLKKDIQSGLFYLKKEDPENSDHGTPKYLDNIVKYYYPENTKKARQHDRRFWGGVATVLGGLGIAIGVTTHEMNKNFEEQEQAEKKWEKEKLPLTQEQIEQQVDTIFQGISGNLYLFDAYDTLRTTLEDRFEEVNSRHDKDARDEIVNYLDSIHTSNPQIFQDFVLEYWKSQNKIADNFREIAGHPNNIEAPISELKDKYAKEKKILNQNQEDLLSRLYSSYKNADGGKTEELVVAHTKMLEDKKQVREIKESPETKKFRAYIDSLAQDAWADYAKVVNSPLGKEVRTLEDRLKQELDVIEAEEKSTKKRIADELADKTRELRNSDAKEFDTYFEKHAENFQPEVWAYLEDYYLMNEVFGDYEGIKDSITENELQVLEKDPIIRQTIDDILFVRSAVEERLKGKIGELNARAEDEKREALHDIAMRTDLLIDPIRAELVTKKAKYDKEVGNALRSYEELYKTLWNEELKKQNIENVEPIEY